MSGLFNLHRLADRRGDGLLPAFTALFEDRATVGMQGRGLALFPGSAHQAGPHPRSRPPEDLPPKVIALQRRGC